MTVNIEGDTYVILCSIWKLGMYWTSCIAKRIYAKTSFALYWERRITAEAGRTCRKWTSERSCGCDQVWTTRVTIWNPILRMFSHPLNGSRLWTWFQIYDFQRTMLETCSPMCAKGVFGSWNRMISILCFSRFALLNWLTLAVECSQQYLKLCMKKK